MRNPFKTVFCKECGHCVPDTQYDNASENLKWAKCHAYSKKRTSEMAVGVTKKAGFYFCTTNRMLGLRFCFYYKKKGI